MNIRNLTYIKKLNSISSTFLANIIVALSKWIILILVARILTPTEVGVYTLAFAITAPISLLINMKLRSLYVTEENEKNFLNYIILRNILNAISFLFIIIIALMFWNNHFDILIVVMLNKLLDLFSEIIYAYFHKKKLFTKISKIMIRKTIFEVVTFGLILLITKNLFVSLFISLIIKSLYVYFAEFRPLNYLIKKQTQSFLSIINILKLGIPLGFVQMIVSLNTNIPRYYLEFFEDVKTLGLFSSIAYLLVIFNLFASSISQFFLPQLHELNKQGNLGALKNYLNRKMNFYVIIIGITITIFLYFFGEFILDFLYGKDYSKMNKVLVIISISSLFNTISWNYDTALMAIRYISIQPKITLITLIVNAVISYYLINNFGIYGASFSLIIISFLQLILRVYFFNKKIERGVINN
ncbi:lipopolysaccharide biosynthesis protein [Macrococcus equi]|uniref:lipopolysaccharide biosynthesis protein n=1 Tax=Macrococcus equi TaxID=3395462 RepID=UPI0039BE2232